MRFCLLVVMLLIVRIGMSVQVDFANSTFQIEQVGEKYFVYPSPLLLTAHAASDLAKNDCSLLASDVGKVKNLHFFCERDLNYPGCRVLKRDIIFRSKEENFQSPPIFYPGKRTWKLTPRDEGLVNQATLKRHVAITFGYIEKDIVVKVSEDMTDAHLTAADSSESSLLSTVTKIVPLAPDNLEPLQFRDGRLRVNNRFLACDLESGNLKVAGKAKLNLSYAEGISEENLDAIWQLYSDLQTYIDTDGFKNLPNLMQAAHLGRRLGLAMHKTGLENSFSFIEIVDDLFIVDERWVKLKFFGSKDELREQQYPSQTFSKDVEVDWSI